MIRGPELRDVQVFSNASAEDLEKVAASAADLDLQPGEYAVHEGDPRALFAVLSGKVEVRKTIDGLERTIGWRVPGQIFGEVPIVFGTPFQGSFRAAEPSRVMRLEAADFHGLAARSPASLTELAALARERMGGLQGIALTPAKKRATLLGERGAASCRAIGTFLARNQIHFDWLTPDAPEGWPGPPVSSQDLPALSCDDGALLRRATVREVAERLGLQTAPRATEYDVVVIGGGPAGLAAGVYGASEGLRTLVIEREAPGGQAETSSRIENYLGFPTGVSGAELARRAHQQALRLGAEALVTRTVLAIDLATRSVHLDGGEVIAAKTFVIATGVSWRRLALEGECWT